jgi:hypothetical protein
VIMGMNVALGLIDGHQTHIHGRADRTGRGGRG